MGGGYAPSCTKCRSKNFLPNPRGVREQIRYWLIQADSWPEIHWMIHLALKEC